MPIKKLELEGMNPVSPLNQVITEINENLDAIVNAIDNVSHGGGVVGPQGLKGDTGLTGSIGPQGETGPAGKDGVDGKDGKDGTNGKDGIQGIQGPTGANGKDGLQGPVGPKGDTGAQGLAGTNGTNGIGLKGFASGYVDAGQFVTLDNLKFSVTTANQRGLCCATVSGTVTLAISANYALAGGASGYATNWPGAVYTTTPSGSWFGWSFPNASDGSVYNVNDYVNQRFYRVTLMIGPAYKNNFISIERLI